MVFEKRVFKFEIEKVIRLSEFSIVLRCLWMDGNYGNNVKLISVMVVFLVLASYKAIYIFSLHTIFKSQKLYGV